MVGPLFFIITLCDVKVLQCWYEYEPNQIRANCLLEHKTSPRADNMDQHISWNTSEMDSFANNIAFIKLSSCDKIGMIVNERLTQIPNCSELWCSYEEFKAIFDKSVTKCDLQSICKELKVSSHDSEDDKF